MAVITYSDAIERLGKHPDSDALEAARERTRRLPYGEIIGAVFPIKVGIDEHDKAWYQVVSLRPLRLSWLPFSPFQVDPNALAEITRQTIYRLIESDI